MYIIGISGKKQSGKDEITKHLLKRFPGSVRIAFADALKEEVARACGVSVQYIEEHKDMFRTILQWWGTEFRRKMNGDDYWIKQWDKKARQVIGAPSSGTVIYADFLLIVVPDVRFVNEAEYLIECSAALWRVDRAQYIQGRRMDDIQVDRHLSEIDLDDYPKFDTVIRNHGTIQNLWQEVDIALEQQNIKP